MTLTQEENKFLEFCSKLPHADYTQVVDVGYKEFWIFLREYNFKPIKAVMSECLKYFRQTKMEFEFMLFVEDQLNREIMPPVIATIYSENYKGEKLW